MKQLSRHVAIFLILFLIPAILSASTRSRSKKRTKDVKEKEVNICDIKERGSPVFCYCDSNELKNATDANCWIFNKLVPEEPLWNYFTSQPNIEKLTFIVRPGGSFTYIPTNVLKELKNVQIVTVQYAMITELVEHAFSNLSTISEINLSRDTIVVLRKWAFENMMNLTTINLDENRIAEINRDVFVNLPNLKKLFLNRNNITIVHDKAFKHLTALQELELNGNEISVVTRDTFQGLKSVTRVDLRNNHLAMIGDRTFIEMQELRELELDQNQIEFISDKALAGMQNLAILRISDNRLVTLEPDFLAGAPNVYLLDLRDNRLKTVTFDNVKPIVTNLYNSSSYLYLEGNKLTCDCRLAWVWGLRNETNNTRLKDALEELTCFLETNNATLKAMAELEMRNQALEVPQNEEEYINDDLRDESDNDDFLGDEAYYDKDYEEGYEDSDSDANIQPQIQTIEGKTGYFRPLFDLKVEELPCPESTREDLMASEQPSSRQDTPMFGSSGSTFSMSSAKVIDTSYSVLALSLCYLFLISYT